MSPRDPVLWRQVVDDLANALQIAIGKAAHVRRNAQTTSEEALRLDASIARAVSVLKRLEPRRPRARRPS
jgi:hypothetical protein